MQTSQEVLAREKLDRVVALVPQEPAGWADLGLLLLRQQELDQGAQQLARAASLAPDIAEIQKLQALAESRRGNLPEAVAHWQRALALDPSDRQAAYALALDTEREGGPENDAAAQRVLEQLVARSDNLAARLEYVRIAAKRGDKAALDAALAPLTAASRTWSPEAQEQLKALLTAAAANPRSAATRVAFLKNVLLREPAYRAALAEVSTPRAEVGQPLMRFVRLKNPDPSPAPADDALTFALTPIPELTAGAVWIGAVSLTGDGNPVVGVAGAAGVRLAGGSGDMACPALRGPARTNARRRRRRRSELRLPHGSRGCGSGRSLPAATDGCEPLHRRHGLGEAAAGAPSRASLWPLAGRHRHRRRSRSRAGAA